MNDAEPELQWELRFGIHTGTMMSRDAENPLKCASLDEAKTVFAERLKGARSIGCKVWYAYAARPNDERVELAPSEPYR